jgi:hypothetical protein
VEFVAPVPLLAVMLMLVNDRLLKAAFHNAVTGKLSDVAGCFFLPLFVSALVGLVWPAQVRTRLWLGAAVTCAVFVPICLSRAVADAWVVALSLVGGWVGLRGYALASDPTDLLTLPLVWVAVLYGRARHARHNLERRSA